MTGVQTCALPIFCLSYKIFADKKSMPNTPPVFSVYVAGLVLKRNFELGGVTYYEELNRRKQEKVNEVLGEGEVKGVLKSLVKPGSRSWMNVVFEVVGDGVEAKFLAGAEEQGIKGIKGHRYMSIFCMSLPPQD